jgi:peptidoglycan/LPS O-acetylase OafA/YrhL
MGRFHGLDSCRAAAMMLGLFFHGAISFLDASPPFGWAIRDRSTSIVVDIFVFVCHTFRMPVFFLLGGFFGRLLHEKLGTAAFLRHRARRLLLPFVVILVPLMASLFLLWKWGESRQPRAVPMTWETAPLSPGHLWFLYYLMMVLAALTIVSRIGRNVPLSRLDRWIRGLVRCRVAIFALAIPTAATLYPMEFLSADTPITFVPQPRILAYYFVFAGFGWLLHRQSGLVEELGRWLWIPLIVALAVFVPFGLALEKVVQKVPFSSLLERWGALYLGALFGWALVVLFLGAFVRWGSRPRTWISVLSDSSYWCYLVHLPIVVALQIVVADLAWPGLLKYAIVMTGTVAACLGSYHAFVRYTFIGAALNGPRQRQSLSAAAAID